MQLVLQALQQCATDTTFNGNTWCFALCIGIHLETGFFVLPFQDCVNYYYSETKNMAVHDEVQAGRRYFTTLWLWYIRNENYEEAEIWQEKVPKIVITRHENILNLFTALYYLEGLILILAYKMDRKMNLDMETHFYETEKLIRSLEMHTNITSIISPRLYHLKAFYILTKNNSSDAFSLLSRAKKLAKKSGNVFEECWVNHSDMAWQQNMPPIVYSFWKDHSSQDEMIYYELDSNDTRLGYFTLEPPLFV